MIGRHDGNDGDLEGQQLPKVGMGPEVVTQRQVDLSGQNGVGDRVGDQGAHLHLHAPAPIEK
jgi:hypothetical protein